MPVGPPGCAPRGPANRQEHETYEAKLHTYLDGWPMLPTPAEMALVQRLATVAYLRAG
ncbi:MAG: hypothetical protein ACRDQG_09175 [Pseudonocardiaceae bacterium]